MVTLCPIFTSPFVSFSCPARILPIVVSHDRDFLEDLTDRLITFQDGQVKEYTKPLEDYLQELRQRELAGIQLKRAAAKAAVKQEPKVDDREKKRLEAEQRNAQHQREKPIRTKIANIEKKIETLEKEKTKIEDAMYEPDYYSDAARVKKDSDRLVEIKTNLDGLFFDWGKLEEELQKAAV